MQTFEERMIEVLAELKKVPNLYLDGRLNEELLAQLRATEVWDYLLDGE